MAAKTVDLTPKAVDVITTKGDAWSYVATFPFDLTGYTIKAQLRVADETVDMSIVDTDLPAGKFSIGQVAAISGDYDVQLTVSGGLPRTYINGRITANQGVTT